MSLAYSIMPRVLSARFYTAWDPLGESVSASSYDELGQNLVAGSVTVLTSGFVGATMARCVRGILRAGKSVLLATYAERMRVASELIFAFADLPHGFPEAPGIDRKARKRLAMAGDEIARSELSIVRDIGSFRQLAAVANRDFAESADRAVVIDHRPGPTFFGPCELQRERDADFIRRLRIEIAQPLKAAVLLVPGYFAQRDQAWDCVVLN